MLILIAIHPAGMIYFSFVVVSTRWLPESIMATRRTPSMITLWLKGKIYVLLSSGGVISRKHTWLCLACLWCLSFLGNLILFLSGVGASGISIRGAPGSRMIADSCSMPTSLLSSYINLPVHRNPFIAGMRINAVWMR